MRMAMVSFEISLILSMLSLFDCYTLNYLKAGEKYFKYLVNMTKSQIWHFFDNVSFKLRFDQWKKGRKYASSQMIIATFVILCYRGDMFKNVTGCKKFNTVFKAL